MTDAELRKHLDAAEKSPKEIAAAVSGLSEQILRYKPSLDKWCVLEILGHLADVESSTDTGFARCWPIQSPSSRRWIGTHGPTI